MATPRVFKTKFSMWYSTKEDHHVSVFEVFMPPNSGKSFRFRWEGIHSPSNLYCHLILHKLSCDVRYKANQINKTMYHVTEKRTDSNLGKGIKVLLWKEFCLEKGTLHATRYLVWSQIKEKYSAEINLEIIWADTTKIYYHYFFVHVTAIPSSHWYKFIFNCSSALKKSHYTRFSIILKFSSTYFIVFDLLSTPIILSAQTRFRKESWSISDSDPYFIVHWTFYVNLAC